MHIGIFEIQKSFYDNNRNGNNNTMKTKLHKSFMFFNLSLSILETCHVKQLLFFWISKLSYAKTNLIYKNFISRWHNSINFIELIAGKHPIKNSNFESSTDFAILIIRSDMVLIHDTVWHNAVALSKLQVGLIGGNQHEWIDFDVFSSLNWTWL